MTISFLLIIPIYQKHREGRKKMPASSNSTVDKWPCFILILFPHAYKLLLSFWNIQICNTSISEIILLLSLVVSEFHDPTKLQSNQAIKTDNFTDIKLLHVIFSVILAADILFHCLFFIMLQEIWTVSRLNYVVISSPNWLVEL